jgi:hypothetical protein
MHECNPIIGAGGRTASIRLAAIILFVTAWACGALAAQRAGATTAPLASAEATPAKIHELETLLADPKVQEWLKQQNEAKSAAAIRGRASRRFGCQRVGYDRISLRRASLRRKIAPNRLGTWGMSVYPSAVLLGESSVRLSSP